MITFVRNKLKGGKIPHIKRQYVTINASEDLPYFLNLGCSKCFKFYEEPDIDIKSHICHGYASLANVLETQICLFLSILRSENEGRLVLVRVKIDGECVERVKNLLKIPLGRLIGKIKTPLGTVLSRRYEQYKIDDIECPPCKEFAPNKCEKCLAWVKKQNERYMKRSHMISEMCEKMTHTNEELVKCLLKLKLI